MPQSSRMMVTFWACLSQAATSAAAAPPPAPFSVEACGEQATHAAAKRMRTSVFMGRILLNSNVERRTQKGRTSGVRTKELQDQPTRLRRLLLLHPMPRAVDQVHAPHLRTGGRLHSL